MASASTPASASAQFVQSYPSEPDENGKVLAMQFARDFTGLKALLPPLRDVLGTLTLADPDWTLRGVKATSLKICGPPVARCREQRQAFPEPGACTALGVPQPGDSAAGVS